MLFDKRRVGVVFTQPLDESFHFLEEITHTIHLLGFKKIMNAHSTERFSICSCGLKPFIKWQASLQRSLTPSRRGSNVNTKQYPNQILKQMTINYRAFLFRCNPQLVIVSPRRIFTEPHKGISNEGFDNQNADLILRQKDEILNARKNMTYVVDSLLGKGTFGQVVKCHLKGTKQIVAIKVIKNSPAFNQQCKAEIEVLRTLSAYIQQQQKVQETQHPAKQIPNHIIQLVDQFVFKKHACLVFPLMACNLFDLLKHHRYEGFSVRLVRKFLSQIVEGLKISEECGVVHADLKPENIMIECALQNPEEYYLRIIDFGSSCFLNRKPPYIYIQSRFYRAPEIILQNDKYTNKIDIWSLGCIAVELLCGTPLFPCAEEYSCLERIIQVTRPQITSQSYVANSPVKSKYFYVDKEGKFILKSREQFSHENANAKIQGCYNKTHIIQQLADLQQYYQEQQNDQDEPDFTQFLDFVSKCLEWEPDLRISATDASYHSFLIGKTGAPPIIDFDNFLANLDTQSNPSSSSSFYEDHQIYF